MRVDLCVRASVMLGFTAVATSTDIDISKDDIDDCQWFSREQLATFYAGTHSPHKTENSDHFTSVTVKRSVTRQSH